MKEKNQGIEKVPPTPGPWYYAYGSIWTTPNGPEDGGISIGGADRNETRTIPTERDSNTMLMAASHDMDQALSKAEAELMRMEAATGTPCNQDVISAIRAARQKSGTAQNTI